MNIPFSQKYIRDVKALYREYEEKRITDEKLSQRLDELKQREARLQKATGQLLLAQQLGEIEKALKAEVQQEIQQKNRQLEIEERAKQTEQTRQQQKEWRERQAEQQKRDLEQKRRERERENYVSEIDTYINRLEGNAQRWQHWYTWLQITLLVFSALTATMAGIDGVPRWVVSGAGFVATIAGSLLTTFKIQERIYANRKAVAEVRQERQKYDYRIEEYKDRDTEAAFVKFSRSISSIQGQQMLQEVELWNPRKEEHPQENRLPARVQEEKEPHEKPEAPSQAGNDAEEQHRGTPYSDQQEEET